MIPPIPHQLMQLPLRSTRSSDSVAKTRFRGSVSNTWVKINFFGTLWSPTLSDNTLIDCTIKCIINLKDCWSSSILWPAKRPGFHVGVQWDWELPTISDLKWRWRRGDLSRPRRLRGWPWRHSKRDLVLWHPDHQVHMQDWLCRKRRGLWTWLRLGWLPRRGSTLC